MLVRLFAFVVWALVAATAVFWGLRLLTHAQSAPAHAVVVGDSVAARSDLSRLLGAAAVVAPLQAAASAEGGSRFKLLGIMAPKVRASASTTGSSTNGVALIAVDGRLPRAYTVGAPVDGDLVLQAVTLRTADIGKAAGAPTVRLELPVLPLAATGALPPAATQSATMGAGVAVAATTPRPVPPLLPPNVPPPVMQAPAMRDTGVSPAPLPQTRAPGLPTE